VTEARGRLAAVGEALESRRTRSRHVGICPR